METRRISDGGRVDGWGTTSDPGVQEAQTTLRRLGYPVPTTGAFDTHTERALDAFQRGRGLPPSGVLDDATVAALREEAACFPAEPHAVEPLPARPVPVPVPVPHARDRGLVALTVGGSGGIGAGISFAVGPYLAWQEDARGERRYEVGVLGSFAAWRGLAAGAGPEASVLLADGSRCAEGESTGVNAGLETVQVGVSRSRDREGGLVRDCFPTERVSAGGDSVGLPVTLTETLRERTHLWRLRGGAEPSRE